MPSVEYDLKYLKLGIEELETYLTSKPLFWPINAGSLIGEPAFPRLTLGSLLLSAARLRARDLTPQQKTELSILEAAMHQTHTKWRVAWERKGEHEFSSRIRQWRNYLNELSRDIERHADFYPNEVRLRVLLGLLHQNMPSLDVELLSAADAFLRMFFKSGDFVWDLELAAGFPENAYWYLWGKPV